MEITKAPAAATRYISKQIREEALAKSHQRCSYRNCNKPPTVFHHPDRFAKVKNHKNIKPLCSAHHEFMHNGIVQNETQEPQNWKIKLQTKVQKIDELYRRYKQAGGYA